MTTLKQMYKELLMDKSRWSYYVAPPELTCNTLFSKDDSYEFIKNYFRCGGKERVFKDDPHMIRNELILKERSPHIISTYLLGILIAESLNCDINMKCDDEINFKYLWFLACLYHDVGYVYEKDHNCTDLRMLQTEGIDAVREICDVKYLSDNEFKIYTKEIVNLYLLNRATCTPGKTGVMDHGIIGGLLLYDRLRKNFNYAWEKVHKTNKCVTEESFTYNNLHFSDKHYKYYAEAADAIIAHNIWRSTLNEYLKKDGKEELKETMINRNNEVAFILALADTLEPIKKYGIYALDMIFLKNQKVVLFGRCLVMLVKIFTIIY